MAKLFQINVPDGMSSLQLDSQRRSTIHYSVKNVSARAIDGRAVLVALPQTPADPNHPVPKGWVKLDGKPERHFEVNGEDTFTVNVLVPPKSPPGNYSFRLDMNWVAKPDEGDSSQAVRFEIPATEKKSPKWGLMAIIALVALLVIGGVTWLLLRQKTPPVPDLKGKTEAEATTILSGLKPPMSLQHNYVGSTPENFNKIISQVPGAGAKPPANHVVFVIVGGFVVTPQQPTVVQQAPAVQQPPVVQQQPAPQPQPAAPQPPRPQHW